LTSAANASVADHDQVESPLQFVAFSSWSKRNVVVFVANTRLDLRMQNLFHSELTSHVSR